MKRIGKYFFQGLLFAAPIAITLYVCFRVLTWMDKPIQEEVQKLFHVRIPGLGVVVALIAGFVGVTAVGFLCSNILTGNVLRYIERQMDRLPPIKLMHSALKDLIGAFVGEKKRFDQPVAVELLPGSQVLALGFITRDSLARWGLDGCVAVYLPQSYNFAGNLLVVPCDRVRRLTVPSGDVMRFIVSGAITGYDADAPAATGAPDAPRPAPKPKQA